MKRLLAGALTALALSLTLPAAAHAAEAVDGSAIAMHGTPKYGPDFRHFDYVNPNAPVGGSIRLGSIGGFDSLNPFIMRGESAPGLTMTYDTLMVASADEAYTKYCLLCSRVVVPADRSWIIFYMRDDAYFHDGTPITVDDVIFTFEMLRTRGAPFFRSYYRDVTGVERVGDNGVRFTFGVSGNRELPLILGELPILPKHYWEGRDFERTTLEPPLGSGPYRIQSLEPGRFIVYERVANYWGAAHPARVGQYNFGSIRYDAYLDANVAFEAFKAGAIDYRVENVARQWATGYDTPAFRNGTLIKEELDHNRNAGMQGFAFNLRRPQFQDARVREALGLAFDYEWTNRNLFFGAYARTESYFQNSELAATGLPEGEELAILRDLQARYPDAVPDRVFTTPFRAPVTDGTGDARTNLIRARDLLREAGWDIPDGQFVLRNARGETLRFEILLSSPAFERVTLPYIRNLRRLGVEVTVRTVDSAQYINRMRSFDFDITVAVWGQSPSPGNEQRGYWSSAAATDQGSRNLAGIASPAIDAAIELLITAPDRESLVQRTRALDRLLQWGFYVVPNWHSAVDRVAYWDRFGHPEITPDNGSNLLTWWVDPERDRTLERRRAAVLPRTN
jgi:microcin C transport system substrate-binding protein